MKHSPVSPAYARTGSVRVPALLYGSLLVLAGFGIYVMGVAIRFLCIFLDPHDHWLHGIQRIVWWSGMPVLAGLFLILVELALLLPRKRRRGAVRWDPPEKLDLTAVLTAYNDEASIGLAVEDFRSHPSVQRVIVIDNNSSDRTADVARRAGAVVIHEPRQGYGHAVWRALREGSRCADTGLTLLCEGDRTFRSYDIDKLLAYLPHADIVNGTRIVEQLRASRTQLTTFMYYGNFFAGKLLEAKYIGRGTFTDAGTTYKLCRNAALERLLPLLNSGINLEFNAYFLDTALRAGLDIVECPVTFHERIGPSKGGNANNLRALRVGICVIVGIVTGWRALPQRASPGAR